MTVTVDDIIPGIDTMNREQLKEALRKFKHKRKEVIVKRAPRPKAENLQNLATNIDRLDDVKQQLLLEKLLARKKELEKGKT